MALALGDYLSSIQLPNHLQHDAEGFSIVLENPDDFVQARQVLEGFLAAPDDPRYWQASWQSGRAQSEPVYARTESAISQRWWQRAGGADAHDYRAMCAGLCRSESVSRHSVRCAALSFRTDGERD
jgi:hypothetical protein